MQGARKAHCKQKAHIMKPSIAHALQSRVMTSCPHWALKASKQIFCNGVQASDLQVASEQANGSQAKQGRWNCNRGRQAGQQSMNGDSELLSFPNTLSCPAGLDLLRQIRILTWTGQAEEPLEDIGSYNGKRCVPILTKMGAIGVVNCPRPLGNSYLYQDSRST